VSDMGEAVRTALRNDITYRKNKMATRKRDTAQAEILSGGNEVAETKSTWDELAGENVELAPEGEGNGLLEANIEAVLDQDIDITRYGPLSIGTHQARAEFRGISPFPGPSGHHYLDFRFVGIDEPDGEATDRVSLSPKSKFRRDMLLDAVGAPKSGKYTVRDFIKMVDGKELTIVTEQDEHAAANGREASRVAAYLPKNLVSGGAGGPTAGEFK
jgi:hypothetical protein